MTTKMPQTLTHSAKLRVMKRTSRLLWASSKGRSTSKPPMKTLKKCDISLCWLSNTQLLTANVTTTGRAA